MEEIYIITHYDLVPPHAEAGKALLERYADETAAAPGVRRVELLQQYYRKNHLELLSVYESLQAYEDRLGAPETIRFREELYPMLGAPIDDRVHVLDPRP